MSSPDGPAAMLDALLADARRHLAGAPREALGELQTGRRTLGIPRAPRVLRRGEAWHLGVLLLGDDAVYATGDVVRAREEARRGFPSEAQRHRAEIAAAARRGGYAEGETVHLGWEAIDLSAVAAGEASGPLSLRDGVPSVRWSAAGGHVPLERYLAERIELLTHPPAGAT
ncbi:glutaminase [Microbacterium sp. CJ88]|uniref:glutaminase n=1 Tax=Microbacterium sp. CJ88 TaxID=3445672 RepID=UPI003F65BFFF